MTSLDTPPNSTASGGPGTLPVTVRARVRDAIDRAWAAAEAAGALPEHPADQPRPAVEVERPAKPEHGDLATNLAMKLARPLPPAAARDRDGPRGARSPRRRPIAASRRSPSVESSPPPGFLNLRLTDGALEATIGPILADARDAGVGSRRSGPRARQRRVRVGQPDRSADDRQRPRRVRRRPAVPRPRGRRPARHARVLLQRLRRPGRQARRLGAGAPARRAGPRGRLPRRLRRRTLAAASPTTSGRRRTRRAPTRPTIVGRWAAGRVRAGIEASLERLGVHFDVWKSEGSLHAEGWVERAIERLRAGGHVYEQDGALWFRSTAFGDDKDRVDHPLERPADLLRGRHRLRHREVQPRLRPPDLHLGRRPPRDGGARAERREGDGLRPRRGPDAALLPGSASSATASGDLDEQAGRRVHHARRAARRGRRRRRALVLRLTRRDDRDRLRHRARQEAVGREPGLLRPVRPRPDRVDPAQGGRRPGSPPAASVDGRLGGAPGGARSPGRSSGSRRSSRTRRGPRRRTA